MLSPNRFAPILLGLVLGGCAGRMAEDGIDRVPAGKSTMLQQTYMTMDERCRPILRPTGRLAQAPRHGSVRMLPRQASAVYGPGPHRHCDGKVGPALAFEYTPEPGYRGPDAFTVRVRYNDGEIRHGRFDVEVY